jgi:hypothetical protein
MPVGIVCQAGSPTFFEPAIYARVYKKEVPKISLRHLAASRFQTWFEASGLTQETAGDRIGQNQAWVSRRLKTGPTIDELDELSRLTGHDPGDFVTRHPVRFDVLSPSQAARDGMSGLDTPSVDTDASAKEVPLPTADHRLLFTMLEALPGWWIKPLIGLAAEELQKRYPAHSSPSADQPTTPAAKS